jgi:hypothetical protein
MNFAKMIQRIGRLESTAAGKRDNDDRTVELLIQRILRIQDRPREFTYATLSRGSLMEALITCLLQKYDCKIKAESAEMGDLFHNLAQDYRAMKKAFKDEEFVIARKGTLWVCNRYGVPGTPETGGLPQ